MPRLSTTSRATLLGIFLFLNIHGNIMAQDAAKPTDPVSYFMGMSLGQQLAQNGFTLDDLKIDQLIRGLEDGCGGKEAAMTDDELRSTQQKIMSMLQDRQKEKLAQVESAGKEFLTQNAKKDGVKVTDSGLQYKVLKPGSGTSPGASDTVVVHYTGTLVDGKIFDSSVKRGQPATFRVGQVIPGWIEGLQLMKPGAKFMFYIPSELAYGERGTQGIPPNSVLTFEVELLEVK
ncbi:MAG: FKBP-type peptidyl-prolyl cis-trans isomerase [Planctomycetota bacterium]